LQFRSPELAVLLLLILSQLSKTNLTSNTFKKDDKGWILVARHKLRKLGQHKLPSLCHEKSQERMMSMTNKEQEVWIVHPLHQKPSGSIALGNFFPKGFFDKVVVNMSSSHS